MLPYNEGNREGGRGQGIEEFWQLGAVAHDLDRSNSDHPPDRHHFLAFFDVLFLDGESLLNETYDTRRSVLERVVKPVKGFVSFLSTSRSTFPLTLRARSRNAQRDARLT